MDRNDSDEFARPTNAAQPRFRFAGQGLLAHTQRQPSRFGGANRGRKLSTKSRGVKRWQPTHPTSIKVIPWEEAMCPWGEVMRLQVIP
jgi:hypothetical protein